MSIRLCMTLAVVPSLICAWAWAQHQAVPGLCHSLNVHNSNREKVKANITVLVAGGCELHQTWRLVLISSRECRWDGVWRTTVVITLHQLGWLTSAFFIVHHLTMMMMPTRMYPMRLCLLQVQLLAVCFYFALQHLLLCTSSRLLMTWVALLPPPLPDAGQPTLCVEALFTSFTRFCWCCIFMLIS